MSWNATEKKILSNAVALYNECGFDVRRDVYMIFKRFRQEGAHDLVALCRFAAAVAEGRPYDDIQIGRRDHLAARTVAEYLHSFGADDKAMAERVTVARLLEKMVEAVTDLDDSKRSDALASIVRRAVKENTIDHGKRPSSQQSTTPPA